MNRNIIKICSIILLSIMVLSFAVTPVFASLDDPSKITPKENEVQKKASSVGSIVLGVAQVVGVAMAIIMLLVLAIKYLSAAPNDKAEIKKHAVVYVVGAVIMFGASGILGIISEFAYNNIK